jgi:thiol-disulfide isomerase/thioredoxin
MFSRQTLAIRRQNTWVPGTGIPRRISLASIAFLVLAQAWAGESYHAPEIVSPAWLNSEPLTLSGLRGKVVLLEFWTFGCYNCRNVEPYVKAWHDRYSKEGLVIIAVHAPEFDHEHDFDQVKQYVSAHALRHPIAIDNNFEIWKRYSNRAWPTFYLIDKQGQVRHVKVGEGDYERMEHIIRSLLSE